LSNSCWINTKSKTPEANPSGVLLLIMFFTKKTSRVLFITDKCFYLVSGDYCSREVLIKIAATRSRVKANKKQL